MTTEEAKKFGLQLLHGIMERNESYPVYANNVKQAIDALSEESSSSEIPNDLEEEIENYYGRMPDDTDKIESARHFAEWGEKNAYKVIMKKADEVRDKMFDTDYEVKIEPAAGFDFGCVNVYHEGKLVGQYVEPKEGKKLSEGLEEAARLSRPANVLKRAKN